MVGVDGSDSSKEALSWTIRQAGLTGATVEAVVAWHFPLMVGGYGWPPIGVLESTDFGKIAERTLTDAIGSAAAQEGAVHISMLVQEGNAAQVLIEAATGAELLVVGSRGYGGFAEALLGSVSQHACTTRRARSSSSVALARCSAAPGNVGDVTRRGRREFGLYARVSSGKGRPARRIGTFDPGPPGLQV